MKTWTTKLQKLNACKEAVEWCQDYDSIKDAWQACKRGDWMLWLIDKTIKYYADKKPLVLVACECARLALPYVAKGEERPLKAIEVAESWVRGESTLDEVRAAEAAGTAAWAAGTAAEAAWAARTAAWAAALSQCADIVRKYYPEAPKI